MAGTGALNGGPIDAGTLCRAESRTPGCTGYDTPELPVPDHHILDTYPCLQSPFRPLNMDEQETLAKYEHVWDGILKHGKKGFGSEVLEPLESALGEIAWPHRRGPLLTLFHLYDDVCQFEYEQLTSSLKQRFDEIAGQGYLNYENIEVGWKYYQYVRPFYVNYEEKCPWMRGHPDWEDVLNRPYRWMIKNIQFDKLFFGIKVNAAHSLLLDRLKAAENALTATAAQELKNQAKTGRWSISGFQPRRTKGRGLSNHGLGLAIDFEGPLDPYITGATSVAIDKILRHKGCKHLTGQALNEKQIEDAHMDMKEISAALQDFLKEWFPRWQQLGEEGQEFVRNYTTNLATLEKNSPALKAMDQKLADFSTRQVKDETAIRQLYENLGQAAGAKVHGQTQEKFAQQEDKAQKDSAERDKQAAARNKLLRDTNEILRSLRSTMPASWRVAVTDDVQTASELDAQLKKLEELSRLAKADEYEMVDELVTAESGGQKDVARQKGVVRVQRYMNEGIINLPVALFTAMKKAQLFSGIEYKCEKDTMHFEFLLQEGPKGQAP